MKLIKLIVALILFLVTANAQQQNNTAGQTSEPPAPRVVYRRGLDENNYLSPLLQLRRREAEYLASPNMRESYLEYTTQLYNFVGDYRAAYATEENFLADLEPRIKFRAANAKDIAAPSPLGGYAPRRALDAIGAAADKYQIVVINEEHRTPVHRALTHRLLAALYAKGFRYFAVETLRADDKELNVRGYPTNKSGFYTFDPVFGDVIRQAIKMGFKTVPYEAEQQCPKPEDFLACANYREVTQAQNIYDRILKNDPRAKILVHAGRGHASKAKETNGFAFMAHHLWTISGIEPFTIDQENYTERHNPVDERPLYRYATGKNLLLPDEPTVFRSREGKFFSDSDGYDLRVFTPRAKYVDGRPEWLRLGGARKSQPLNLKKLNISAKKKLFAGTAPFLVQAVLRGESVQNAIPIDQIILYPNKEIPVLLLPEGAFLIRAIDESGSVVGSYPERVR